MPGVYRQYTLADILGQLNNNSTTSSATDTINGLGQFIETAEAFSTADSVTGTLVVASTTTWDNATWGTFVWT